MIGLIARADSRGLGIQTKAFFDNMNPAKTLVVDCPSQNPLPVRGDWYPDAQWVHGLPSEDDFAAFLDGLTAVYTAETAYTGRSDFWALAEARGVKTVLAANFEFLDTQDRPSVWAAPSMWRYDEFPQPKTFLPFPIETNRFPEPSTRFRRFLHIVGRPAIHDRNGTRDLIQALQYIKSSVTVTFRCQQSGYVEEMLQHISYPFNVTVVLESGDLPNYWDAYNGHDVVVMPRRFGGQCLPANEALGAGMPVIMPDISPNNLWLPSEWLVTARQQTTFRAKQQITVFETALDALAQKIDEFAKGEHPDSHDVASALGKQLSWDTLKLEYQKVLCG